MANDKGYVFLDIIIGSSVHISKFGPHDSSISLEAVARFIHHASTVYIYMSDELTHPAPTAIVIYQYVWCGIGVFGFLDY